MHAVFTAGERRLHIKEKHQLGQRQGNHGEVDTLAADGQQCEGQAQNGGDQGTGQDSQLGGQPRVLA